MGDVMRRAFLTVCVTMLLSLCLAAVASAAPTLTQVSGEFATPPGLNLFLRIDTQDNEQETAHVDYGTTAAYGTSTPDQTTPTAVSVQSLEFDIGNLSPGTTYHYRYVVSSPSGTAQTGDLTINPPTAQTNVTSTNGKHKHHNKRRHHKHHKKH